MPQFGSNLSISAQNRSAVTDSNGNLIVSPDDGFGGSPLGVAARTQALYGIPNANFDILPPDAYTAITVANPLPYWDVAVNGLGTATMSYDDTTQAWSVRLNPTEGTAAGETITMKARTYLLNDSNFTLRQRAFLNLTKIGTQATSEWNLVLSATYYSEAGVQLSTYNIGTANSGSAFTTINGFTTSGTAAIDAAAHYADLAITLTTSGSVAGTAMVDLNSLILQTSTGQSSGFLITDTYTSSGNWVRPASVNYVTVVGIGAGGGGGSGGARISATTVTNAGGSGGAGARWSILENLYVGNLGTVAIGIGAGGSGGTAVLNTVNGTTVAGVNGSAGGATTFGSLLSIPGGGAGSAGGGTVAIAGGTAGTVATSDAYDFVQLTALDGGQGNPANGNNGSGQGTAGAASSYRILPFTPIALNGDNGTNGSNTNGTAVIGAIGTAVALGYGGGGGGGGGTNGSGTGGAGRGGNASSNMVGTAIFGTGAGGGGGARAIDATPSVLNTVVGGNGGNAGSATGAGGGGGGAAQILGKTGATYSCTSGRGGNGSGGVIYVIYTI